MMRKVRIEDAGDTKFLEGDTEDRFDFNMENDFIFDKKVITEAGESTKLKSGQIVTLREVREENSILRRADKKLAEFRDAKPATSSPLLPLSPRHHWVHIAGYLPHRSRKQPRFFLLQPYRVKQTKCLA